LRRLGTFGNEGRRVRRIGQGGPEKDAETGGRSIEGRSPVDRRSIAGQSTVDRRSADLHGSPKLTAFP
jgi:hypothetical protein